MDDIYFYIKQRCIHRRYSFGFEVPQDLMNKPSEKTRHYKMEKNDVIFKKNAAKIYKNQHIIYWYINTNLYSLF